MTLRGQSDVGFILYRGYDIMGLITGLSEDAAAVLEQSDGLGASTDEHTAVGITKFDLSFDGFYDSVILPALEALTGKGAMIYSLISNTIGDRAIGVNALDATITRGPSKDGLTKANMAFKSDEGHDAGQISAPHAVRTTQGPTETATDDWGAGNAPSTAGAIAYLVCDDLDLDSGTALQVDIIDSNDDITFFDLMTFTALTVLGGERKTVAGNVERYTQTRHEFTGGSGGNRTCKFATVLIRN